MRDDVDVEERSVPELVALVAGRDAPEIVARAGGLERLSRANAREIAALFASSRRRDAVRSGMAVAAAFELGRRTEADRCKALDTFGSPADVARWAAPRLATLTHEELWLLAVDGRGRRRGTRCIGKGGLHGAAVRASDPLRAALSLDACAFVLVHNHPSGDPTPSREDVAFTRQVAAAAAVVGVPLLDHVVVARDGFSCVPFVDERPDGPVVNGPDHRRGVDGSAR